MVHQCYNIVGHDAGLIFKVNLHFSMYPKGVFFSLVLGVL